MGDTVDIAIKKFNAEFVVAYQSAELLQNTSLEVVNEIGDSYQWPTIDKVDMYDRGPYNSLPDAVKTNKDKVITTYNEKMLRTALGNDEKTLVNVDERQIWVDMHGDAVGRYKDSLKIAALDAVTTNVVPVDYDGSDTNLTYTKLLYAQSLLTKGNIPRNAQIICAVSYNQWLKLMQADQFVNNEYFRPGGYDRPPAQSLDGWLNMRWIVFGDDDVNGLPLSGDDRSVFMWHSKALGIVSKMQLTADVYYEKLYFSWLADSMFIGGASVLKETGVVKILCDETK